MLAWAGEHGVDFYQISCGNGDNFVGLRLWPDIASILESSEGGAGGSGSIIDDIKSKSGCAMSVRSIARVGSNVVDPYLVFQSDFTSSAASVAADLVSLALRDLLSEHGDGAAQAHQIGDGPDDQSGLLLDDPNSFDLASSKIPNIIVERVHRQIDIPQSIVGLVAGKGGKKLFAMRKKSGAYMSLVSKSKSRVPGRLTISGTAESVETALSLVRNAIAESNLSF